MLQRIKDSLEKTLGKWKKAGGNPVPAADPHVVPRDQHNISRRNISDAALKVMARLRGGGFKAYLVGGGVRDLLLGMRPKDFDIATDARPEQVRELFRNSMIIGRRFKIVHVRFGREVIEVTTFRGNHSQEGEAAASLGSRGRRGEQAVRSESGMLLRDNVYGSIEEDAIRRDFTVNALYYTTEDFSVHDYADGLKDLHARRIRLIGDPETRYREDPVRMLRAVRFAAKLDFSLDPATAQPLRPLAPLLRDVPAARMFDEVLKLFMAGHAQATWALLRQHDLFHPLFPATAELLDEMPEPYEALILAALRSTDRRLAEDKPVTPAFLFAALLWPCVQREYEALLAQGVPELPALHQAAQEVADRQQGSVAIPRRFGIPMREIWELQVRLPRRSGRRALNLLEHKRLRAGYDFLLLREEAGEDLGGLGAWWTEFMEATEEHRDGMLRLLQSGDRKPRRRRRRN